MKKRFGDRRDGTLLRDLDSMHIIMPIIYPNRCDNEAYISECVDLTNAAKWLERQNAADPEYKYNLFQLIVTAILKCITLRPKMNRFIANKNMYQRNYISASFVVKKQFDDDGGEALATVRSKGEDTVHSIHDEIFRQVSFCRSDSVDKSTESMDIVCKLPRFLVKAVAGFTRVLDRHGKVPKSFIETDPYYNSVILTNLGSIKLHAGYHHLTNWGTTSVFCIIGERKVRPFYDDAGNVTMRESIDIGLTVDERIADGYYYSKTVRLFRTLLEHPELLELPLNNEVDY